MKSHHFKRLFNPYALHAPRGFVPIDNTPIYLEIGAGKGKHALLFANQNPQQTLYAIERTAEKFHAFDKLAKQAKYNNLIPIHADAISWVVYGVFPQQIKQCFILYPNPEPHNKNQRFLNMPFFEFLLSRLTDNGQIILASNITEYINEAEQLLKETWCLNYQKINIPKDSKRTHFEIKYLQRGEMCQELIITKPAHYQTRFDKILPLGLNNE